MSDVASSTSCNADILASVRPISWSQHKECYIISDKNHVKVDGRAFQVYPSRIIMYELT